MNNPVTDLIFPPHRIALLSHERGKPWRDLIHKVENSRQDGPEQMAFILMLARINNCSTCNADSYRAMQGCDVCARQSLKRYHGSDEDLIDLFEIARDEVDQFLQKNK